MNEAASHVIVTDTNQLPAPPPGFAWAKLEDVISKNNGAQIHDDEASKIYKQLTNSVDITESQSYEDIVLDLELRLNMDIHDVGNVEAFISQITDDLSQAALVSPPAIQVTEVRADGGIVVDVSLCPSARDLQGRSTLQISDDLAEQARDPRSVLMRGKHTSRTAGFWIKAPRVRSANHAAAAAAAISTARAAAAGASAPATAAAVPPIVDAVAPAPARRESDDYVLVELHQRTQVRSLPSLSSRSDSSRWLLLSVPVSDSVTLPLPDPVAFPLASACVLSPLVPPRPRPLQPPASSPLPP
jgi:hypothetical protein